MLHKMRFTIETAPDEARAALERAYRDAGCHTTAAAEALGCRRHTFLRWVRLLGMEERLAELARTAEKEGWHHGKKGGGHLHKDPAERARKMKETIATRRARKLKEAIATRRAETG